MEKDQTNVVGFSSLLAILFCTFSGNSSSRDCYNEMMRASQAATCLTPIPLQLHLLPVQMLMLKLEKVHREGRNEVSRDTKSVCKKGQTSKVTMSQPPNNPLWIEPLYPPYSKPQNCLCKEV